MTDSGGFGFFVMAVIAILIILFFLRGCAV